jgi:poly(A) polymerase
MAKPTPGLRELLTLIASITNRYQYRAYLVGGFIRDWMLDRETSDIDFTINGDVYPVAEELAQSVGGTVVLLDNVNKIARVVAVIDKRKWQCDFGAFYQGIEEDLHRRDFTIDAMAIDLNDFVNNCFRIIDPFKGQEDIVRRQVKSVTEEVFKDDPARLLRAVRIAAELGFIIESATENLMRTFSDLTKYVAGERLRSELVRLLNSRFAGHWLQYLDRLNILTELIPELRLMKNIEQPKEHYWDVFEHSVQTVNAVEFILGEGDWNYSTSKVLESFPVIKDIEAHLGMEVSSDSNRKVLLKLGCLLHDVAKPQTKNTDKDGRIRFIGHGREGANTAAEILNRLRFSNKETKTVKNLVSYHLRPVQMANTGCMPTGRAVYRFFRDAGDDSMDILYLAFADYLAARGPNLDVEEWKQHCFLVEHILKVHHNQEYVTLPVKLIDGNDVMEVLSLTSGPLVGKLLTLVREAQAVGEVQTREEAIAYIRREMVNSSGQVSN